MEDFFLNVPLSEAKRELRRGYVECNKRGLMKSAKWLAEMCYGLNDVDIDSITTTPKGCSDEEQKKDANCIALDGIDRKEYDNYILAKSYFDLQEFDRSAHFTRNCASPVPRFLHLYATYMAIEKKRLDSLTDQTNINDSGSRTDLADLLSTLREAYLNNKLDGYGMYLYGVVLNALSLHQIAIEVLTHSIRTAPMLWAAYLELAPLINEKEKLMALKLGTHWMKHFFIALTYIELYLNDEGIKAYEELQNVGFRKCLHIVLQLAVTYHHKRDVDKALEIFKNVYEEDPYCLDHVDLYSNLLYVKDMKTEMAQLAHKAVGINKYLPETCCAIGNYYSIRSEHQKAILYFQRALKLNPKYLSAWTLMGHEFMELKNTNAAIQSYRKAVEVNKRDYRAWYGLGQSYEILKMHYYSLYYFKNAHLLRPFDSRMLVALGETYEKLSKTEHAISCYWKACDVGDIEGIAMYKLACLYEKLGNFEDAVSCFAQYCADEGSSSDKQGYYHAFMSLANFHEMKGNYDRASYYAYKCLESDDRKNEAKALLKSIENKRACLRATKLGFPNTPGVSALTPECNNTPATQNTLGKNVANADTSSDDDMDIEFDSYKSFQGDDSNQNTRKSSGGTACKVVPTISAALQIRPEIFSRINSSRFAIRDLSLTIGENDLTSNDPDSSRGDGGVGGGSSTGLGGSNDSSNNPGTKAETHAGNSRESASAAVDAENSNISTQTGSGETTSEATTSTINNRRQDATPNSNRADGDEETSSQTMQMDISTISMD